MELSKVFGWLVVAALGGIGAEAQARPTPRPSDLGTLGGATSFARDLNNRTEVVGDSTTTSGETHAFLWARGRMRDLGTLGGSFSTANGINQSGQIVGLSSLVGDAAAHGFLFENGRMIDLGALFGDFSEALDINERDQIVGQSQSIPVIWNRRRIEALDLAGGDNGFATAINNRGQISGSVNFGGTFRAVRWVNGVLQDLGTLGGPTSSAEDINERGQITGTSDTATGGIHAFLWDNGRMIDLGTVGPDGVTLGSGLNNAGLVVGAGTVQSGEFHALLFQGRTILDLGTLPGATDSSAFAINERREIVGTSGGHATLWSR
jgi:probable HAF family extracellular repeat protein